MAATTARKARTQKPANAYNDAYLAGIKAAAAQTGVITSDILVACHALARAVAKTTTSAEAN